MTYFADGSAYSFLDSGEVGPPDNVGWLSPSHPYQTGIVPEELVVDSHVRIYRNRLGGACVMSSLTLNLTPEIRAALENMLTTAGRLEDDARIIEHFQDDLFGALEEFRVTVYEPLRDKRSVKTGPGRNYALDLQDAGLVFDVIKGIDEGWSGGTPWKAMSPAERSAVDRFLGELRQPPD